MFRRLPDRLPVREEPLRFLGVEIGSRTLILGDVGYHLMGEAPLSTRLVASPLGVHGRFGPTPDFRWTIRNDRTGRASLRRILEWEFDRPVLGHGSMIETDGGETVLDGFEQVL